MSKPVVLFHVSDIHFGYENRAALDWFAAEVEREKPDWVLCTGDLTMRGNAREFAAASRWLAALAAPVAVDIGNHDVPYYWYLFARIFRPYRRFARLAAEVGRPTKLADIGVVPLRTVAAFQWRLNMSKGHVAPSDLDEALRGLSHVTDKGLKLVTCHHPLVEADTQGTASTRHGTQALTALAHGGADAVLSGHVHDPFDITVECDGQPIRLIGAGTLSQRLRATRPSFNRLEWTREAGLTVSVRSLD